MQKGLGFRRTCRKRERERGGGGGGGHLHEKKLYRVPQGSLSSSNGPQRSFAVPFKVLSPTEYDRRNISIRKVNK